MTDRHKYALAYAGAGLATLALWAVIIAAGASLGYLLVQLAAGAW